MTPEGGPDPTPGAGGGARPGVLVLVGTPIGNLGDLSPRAVAELARADAVACEDTRRTGRLLAHIGVRAPVLIVVNDHTELARIDEIVSRLQRGERVALVTDAGMPGISDPGERLVRAAVDEGLTVEVVPGPSAPIAALAASGLPTGRFVFEGFLPRKGSGRTQRLHELRGERRTIVLFESPHRLVRTLHDLAESCGGDRRIALARELTKLHEETWRGTVAEAIERADEVEPRGEYVVIVDGAPEPDEADDGALTVAVLALVEAGSSTKDAAAEVAARFGVAKRRVYDLAVAKPPHP